MFNEILKITPKLDGSALARMESSLNSRFSRVAKKFGSGLKSAIMGGGVTALALGVIDKILNPLKETQDAIDKILSESNDLSTMAKEFNTSSGKLFKLQRLAEAKGMDSGTLNMLMEKFQVAVAEAIHDPTKDTSVRAFAVPGQDNADLFFNFIQSLQKMKKSDQLLVQQEIFGEKQILRASEFLGANFPELQKRLGLASADAFTPKLEKGSKLNDEKQALEAIRTAQDTMNKLDKVNMGMVTGQDQNEKLRLARETRKFDSFQTMNNIDIKMQTVTALLETSLLKLTSQVDSIQHIEKSIDELKRSKLLRGIFGFGKGN